MKNKITFKTISYFVLALFPLVIVLILYSSLPERIPIHYNFSGEIDSWGGKFGCFTFPIITIAFALILQLLKLTKNKVANIKPYESISLGILSVLNIFNFIFLYYCFYPRSFGIGNLSCAAISIMFIVLGNFFPKLKQNSMIGIRLTWTLKNETVWYKTHRLGGFVWVIGGIIMLPLCLFVPSSNSTLILIIGLTIITIIPSVYSYVIYKRLTNDFHD